MKKYRKKTVIIERHTVDRFNAPVPGARKVWWLVEDEWRPVGWLYPAKDRHATKA